VCFKLELCQSLFMWVTRRFNTRIRKPPLQVLWTFCGDEIQSLLSIHRVVLGKRGHFTFPFITTAIIANVINQESGNWVTESSSDSFGIVSHAISNLLIFSEICVCPLCRRVESIRFCISKHFLIRVLFINLWKCFDFFHCPFKCIPLLVS
jgi:hypothetical protein